MTVDRKWIYPLLVLLAIVPLGCPKIAPKGGAPTPGPIIDIINDGGNSSIHYDPDSYPDPLEEGSEVDKIDINLMSPTLSGAVIDSINHTVRTIPADATITVTFMPQGNMVKSFTVKRGALLNDITDWTCWTLNTSNGNKTPLELEAGPTGKVPPCVFGSGWEIDKIEVDAGGTHYEGDMVILVTKD